MSTDTLTYPAGATGGPPVEPHRHERKTRLFDGAIIRREMVETFLKLTPRQMVKAPVLFVVYIGSIWATVIFLRDVGHNTASDNVFEALVLAVVGVVGL